MYCKLIARDKIMYRNGSFNAFKISKLVSNLFLPADTVTFPVVIHTGVTLAPYLLLLYSLTRPLESRTMKHK